MYTFNESLTPKFIEWIINKRIVKLKVKYSEIPHYAFTLPLPAGVERHTVKTTDAEKKNNYEQ